jgi:hypothetical protein
MLFPVRDVAATSVNLGGDDAGIRSPLCNLVHPAKDKQQAPFPKPPKRCNLGGRGKISSRTDL